MPTSSPARTDDDLALSVPIPQSQPEYLAAIARIRGMQPSDVAAARVLEIGCGDGSNLIPLAERYPQSTLLGIDESPRHVAAAEALAAELGLTNLEFRHQSVREFAPDGDKYDYLIAADVYSWIDEESRDKLLAICHEHLAPHGVAYVNYNVYPGWQPHDLLRAMMRYQARAAETAAQKVVSARALLEFLKASLPADDGGYGSLLHPQLEELLKQSDAFLLRNYLEDVGHAQYYGEFVAHGARHGLQMLGDCGLGIRHSDPLAQPIENALAAITTDVAKKEQFRDIVRNRVQRQSLLCHDTRSIQRWPGSWRLRGLYLEARLEPADPRIKIESTWDDKFVGPEGVSVSTAVPSIKAALAELGAIWPNYILYDDLVASATKRVAGIAGKSSSLPPAELKRLEDNLLQCCAKGIIRIHGAAPPFAAEAGDRPTASPLARWQSARGDVVTNRKHARVRLAQFDQHLVALLDGTRSRAELAEQLTASIDSGRMAAVENGQAVPPERLAPFLANTLDESLERLADSALLVG